MENYIQSAYMIPDHKKREQETASLRRINDSFRKVVITADDIASYIDKDGITYISLMKFLSSEAIL